MLSQTAFALHVFNDSMQTVITVINTYSFWYRIVASFEGYTYKSFVYWKWLFDLQITP